MAFDDTPTTWIPSWSENGTDITVPIASFPELTAAEADGTTGDIRKIAWAIAKKLSDVWYATESANRPANMIISKASSVNSTADEVTHTITFRFVNTISGQDVKAEA